MVEAKALFKKHLKDYTDDITDNTPDKVNECLIEFYGKCILAAAITNAKDEIVAEIKRLQKARPWIE